MFYKKYYSLFTFLILVSSILAACQPSATPTPQTIVETVVVTEIIEGEPVEVIVTATPVPVAEEPSGPRTLVICMGQEPETLYGYGSDLLAQSSVLESIYDGFAGGGIDDRSFSYQPVILEKIPSLADGDAAVQEVEIGLGTRIVDDSGVPTTLVAGVVYRPSGCNSSDCAETYEAGGILMDQLVVTFKMLPGLLWSDGTPLTAHDSVYSFNLAADPDTPVSKFTIDRSASYTALDDITIQWTGLPGYKDSVYFTNLWQPYPQHIWEQYTSVELLTAEESAFRPMGYGPYIIDEWVVGDNIRLHKNDNYFRSSEGLPRFDNLIFRFVGENSNANIAKVLSGECDVVDQTSHLDDQSELLLQLQAAGQVNATFVTGTTWEHMDFGIHPISYDNGWQPGDRPDFFSDVRTRQAIAMCVDRQAVVDTVLFGQSIVLDTYLPPQHPLFNANVQRYDYDVAVASKLFDEVGWIDEDGDPLTPRVYQGNNPQIPTGTPLTLNYWTTTSTQRQQVTQLFAQNLSECGVQVNLEYWSAGEFFADAPDGPLFGRRFDMGQFAFLTGVEPPCDLYITEEIAGDNSLLVRDVPWLQEVQGSSAKLDAVAFASGWGGTNNSGYSSPEYDNICGAALQSLPGLPAYEENHLRAQEIFAEDLPVVPLYLRLKLAATRPDMCNFIMDPTANSEMWNIEAFDYGDSC